MADRPTELAITIAALSVRHVVDHWLYANEIRGQLARLGFNATTQQVAAWLGLMCTVDAPWFERTHDHGGMWRYRVTRFGVCDVENKVHGMRVIRAP